MLLHRFPQNVVALASMLFLQTLFVLRRLGNPTLLLLPVLVLAVEPLRAELNVVATTTDLGSIAREIAGDLAKVTSIAKGYQDPHFIDAKPSYLVRLQRADLFVLVGMDLERGWAPNLLMNSRNAKIQRGGAGYVDASEGVDKLQIPVAADRTMGDIHPYGNPHYWLDPANGRIIAANIAAGLIRVDPAHAQEYEANLRAFLARLEAALARWAEDAAALEGLAVVAYHDSWPYFEQRFGFEAVAFVEPKPGIPPSGRYIAALVEEMKSRRISIILMTSFYSSKTARLIARQSGATLVTLGQSVDGIDGADDYFSLFDTNLSLLLQAAREGQGGR
ncbi:MAG: zinc ABC transporter substrate-binding protein [Acidobacteria bacterium]|nr:zinc ABC transporter substrate-binding protein [Acidobacteriota bacterium]